ncbi:hypothetical protein ATCC90586_000288 [Pythium insidiosum]|nr:hypothetical protein ATCC90586_000288 [Pythium insidiosum]
MIPRNVWHMMSGLLRRKVARPEPGALMHFPSVWKSRAGLTDCNFGPRLVENAYFRHMELGIWYACGAQGILHACARNRWYFVFGSQALRHYKDINRLQPFEIHTCNIYWDNDWMFLLAHFRCPDTGEVFAEGLTRVMLRHGRERVDPRLLYDEMGLTGVVDKEEVPEFVQKFLAWDAESEKSMKRTADFNAVRCANSKRPSLLSAYSMNLPFFMPEMKQD